ncbi:LacI family DNA-binding transcriptional regulator [Mesorhizobium sp. B3-2-1]|uniref:LacI family DNA-binding transcriptional regulator n=1 Tax=unclassified Mesorhizobium TaxID=325217 RepID=UPI001128F32F|nr:MULTISPECIES: LacI family DNA-binding transcriptional regulator [unclassified Mesorhizobium]MBZ9672645.1 LacI family DNA-binding transcriptional regulator [Mesorhizobium sp. ES1-3]TPI26680.1 LacI family DNA-binding transcriptional regulator [Mesorhizobium sp. B3-2-1]
MAKAVSSKSVESHAPTMADVAERAGVSAMTVSRALKEGSRVSKTTREKIMAAVNDLGYVLDQSAGTLSSRKTGFVAAIVPSINNSNFADTARGITDELESTGLQLLLGYTDYTIEKEERLIEAMLRRRPEGIILTGGAHTERARRLLASVGIPVVETWELPVRPIDQVVGFSNEEAMGLLVKTLARKGYRKFGYIGGTTSRDTRGSQRREGFVRAIEELGLPPGRLVSFGVPPISIEQGGQALVSMLERWPDTEAVLCVSDLSAFGALMECKRRGLQVPKDIAIAGFGDYEVAAFCHPGITTVNVDCYGIGRQAARRLIQIIRGDEKKRDQEIVLTAYRVVEREST